MKTIDTLKRIGFTEYEAKTYLALLSESPMTGYAIAKKSGVPRSKIYEVLDTLVKRGDILVSSNDVPLYQATKPTELIKDKREKINSDLSSAEEELKMFQSSGDDYENIWNINGHDNILNKTKELIDKAEKRILIEIWKEDFEEIDSHLKAAAHRGVEILIIAYGDIAAEYAKVYDHSNSEDITAEYGGRWIVFSADNNEVLAGIVSLEEKSKAAWTVHKGLVMPITEVIIHDLYIQEILLNHKDILEETFGENLLELRKKFAFYNDNKKHYID